MKKYIIIAFLASIGYVQAGEPEPVEPIVEPIEESGTGDDQARRAEPGVPRGVIEGGRDQQTQPNRLPVDPTRSGGMDGTRTTAATETTGVQGGRTDIVNPVPTELPVTPEVISQTSLHALLQDNLSQLATKRQALVDDLTTKGMDRSVSAKVKSFFQRMSNFFTGKSNVQAADYITATNQATSVMLDQMNFVLEQSVTQLATGPLKTNPLQQLADLQQLIVSEAQQVELMGRLAKDPTYKTAERQAFAEIYNKLRINLSQAQEQAQLIQQFATDTTFGPKVLFADLSNPEALDSLGIDADLSEPVKQQLLKTLQAAKAQITPVMAQDMVQKTLLFYSAVKSGKSLSSVRSLIPEEQAGYTITISTIKAVSPLIESIMAQAKRMSTDALLASKFQQVSADPLTELQNAIYAQAYDYQKTYMSLADAFAQADPASIDAWSKMVATGKNIFVTPADAQNFATIAANLTRLSQVLTTFNKSFNATYDSTNVNSIDTKAFAKFQRDYNALLTPSLRDQVLASLKQQLNSATSAKQREYVNLRIQALTTGATGGNSGRTTPAIVR